MYKDLKQVNSNKQKQTNKKPNPINNPI
jgi:hypothetical protein